MRIRIENRPVLWASLALLLATLGVYWRVLSCDFINYDDFPYVSRNPHVHAGLTLQSLRWAFNIGYASNWHPLTWLSHIADCQVFGLQPRGHHLTNLIFHVANTLLLFGILKRMTGALWRSMMVAALFALHPAHVESVAWVAERKDVLSTFFFLLTLGAYAGYVEQSKVFRTVTSGPWQVTEEKAEAHRHESEVQGSKFPATILHPPSWFFYALALLCFILGLMSKPMVVTLPFVLLLLDYWPLRRFELSALEPRPRSLGSRLGSLLLEKAPFFALAILSSVVTILAQRRGGSVVPIEVIALDARCWNALVSCLRYAGKLFWPQNLAVIYPYVREWPSWLIGLAAAFVLGTTWLALKLRRQAPYLPVGWFWYLGTLVPVIGLVQVGEQAMADRYTYIPSIGFFLAIGWAIPQLLGKWPYRRSALAIGAALVLAACSTATCLQLRHWRDGISLFEHALAATENNAVAHATLGLALMDQGKLDQAVAQYEAALQISPDYSLAHNNLGVAFARLGRFDEAMAHYESALQLNPKDAEAHFNLANALNPGYVDTYAIADVVQNHRADAQRSREHYQAALDLYPHYVYARVNWGNLELTLGRPEAAIKQYQEAIRIDPLTALAHFNLGNALAKIGKTNDATVSYTRAVQIEPDDPEARFRLANLLASQDQFESAIPHYQRVLALKPDHFMACCNLGGALAKLGRLPEASRCFRETIRIRPEYPDGHAYLGQFLALQGNLEAATKEYSEALRLEPNDPDLHRQTALLLARQGSMKEAVSQFSAAAELRPQDPTAHYELGLAQAKIGNTDRAVEHFREAVRLKPDYVEALNNLAWILATHREAAVRNGTEAVRLATWAGVLTGYKEANVLSTLAAAYAEDGRFADAVDAAQQTCELALAAGRKELADTARARLKLYEAAKPYHEGSPSVSK
jgi:protein O-mannosyl-transferase